MVTEQQAACRFQYEPIMFCFATSPQVPLFPALLKHPAICIHLKITASFLDLFHLGHAEEESPEDAGRQRQKKNSQKSSAWTREWNRTSISVNENTRVARGFPAKMAAARLDPADRLQADARDFANRYLSVTAALWLTR